VEPKRKREENFEEGQLQPSDLSYPDTRKEEPNFKTVDKVAEEGAIEETISDSTQRLSSENRLCYDDSAAQ